MLEVGQEWILHVSPFRLKETTTPTDAQVPADVVAFYAKDSSGTSTLCYKNDAGTEICFPTSGAFVTGAGVVNRLAFWSSASAIDDVPRTLTEGSVLFIHSDFLPQEDNTNFFWNNTDKRLGIKTNAPAMELHVVGTIRSDFTSGQVYDVARRAGDLRLLSIQSQTSGDPHNIELYTKDGDGTDAMSFNMFVKGLPSDVTNRELVQLTYDTSTPHFALVSDAGGTGTVRPLKLYTGANTTQLVLNTDGTINIGSVLDAATGFRIAGAAASGNILRGNGTNFVSSAQSGIDHGSIGGLVDDDHTQYVLRSILTTRGDLFVRDASAVARLAVGGTGTLFTGGTDPSWVTTVAASYVPTWGGFSAAPTSGAASYIVIGTMVFVSVRGFSAGTSNATTKTITLPLSSRTGTVMAGMGHAMDNGSFMTLPCRLDTRGASTTCDVYMDLNVTPWTASGGCVFDFILWYDMAI